MATRAAIFAIFTSVVLVLSLAILDLRLAVTGIFIGTLFSLYPLIIATSDSHSEPLLRALLSYQLMGIFLLAAAMMGIGTATEHAALLLFLSMLLRLTLSFSTRSFFSIVFLIAPLPRLLFYFSSVVYSIFIVTRAVPRLNEQALVLYLALPQTIAFGYLLTRTLIAPSASERLAHLTHAAISLPILSLLFDSEAITLTLCSAACVFTLCLLQAQTRSPTLTQRQFFGAQSFLFAESIFLKVSLLSHRLFGPILIEWIFVRVLSASTVLIRLCTRLFSYASIQRHFATALFVATVLLIYVLRL